ncbi:M3 family metallopeptidase [Ferrimonas balearica]|uniref:M3 family metallopeptidase n=1 Tax=Ferrimonas balearica TaxID=44012 RepID=UPI001C999675|nr:M3 family metallopeptidase [Ferrimonas balearica]MBY5921581.1 M3 family metallopeptidase [Ferrimonas balearica]MBY5995079.1 M3 family metallopeptidase [Ferrimonas balearica]
MLRKTLLASSIVLGLAACSDNAPTQPVAEAPTAVEVVAQTAQLPDSNPFKHASTLQYQAPDFTKITDEHFKPAFEAGMAEHMAEIDAIANNPEAATFENTLVAMEKSGALLTRTAMVFYNLSSSTSNDARRALETEMGPKFAEHQDNVYLNAKLFERVKAIYEHRAELGLDAEAQRLTEVTYEQFVRAGADLTPEQKLKVRELNKKLSELTNQFGQNLLAASQGNAVLVTDLAQLAGLSEGAIASAKAAAEKGGQEGYLLTLTNTTRQAALSSLENRELRQRLWEASAFRATSGEADNQAILTEIATLRAEKAALFGFNNWAEYKLQSQMAKNPNTVMDLLGSMVPKVVANAQKEADDIAKMMAADGIEGEVQAWDWLYYAEKVRQQKFNLDAGEVAKYFVFDKVLEDGVFYTMNRQYGITFKPRPDLPAYHPDVEVYEIFDKDGESMALFYADYYAREGKRGGAWMNVFVGQSHLLNTQPVIVNVMNIEKAGEGQPQLVSFDEATTMFHEMGHAVHGLFSDVTYPSLAGTNVSRDFVEFPSTFQEDWAVHPEVIANYAKHVETGEPIPADLLAKVMAASKFNLGFDTLEYLASALLDMEWHTISADAKIDSVAGFEAKALEKHGVKLDAIPPRYKSTYFAHIFAGGYSAGYYAYLWSEILAADAFAHIRDTGGLTRERGQLFRDKILSMGNSQDLMETYKGFKGDEPTTEALLIRRGISLAK